MRTPAPRSGAIWIVVVLAAVASSTPVSARQETPRPTPPVSAYLQVLASSLNVRAAPSLDARVVGSVSRGARVCLVRYDDSWAEIRSPMEADAEDDTRVRGWVSRGFVSERRVPGEELEAMGCPAARPD